MCVYIQYMSLLNRGGGLGNHLSAADNTVVTSQPQLQHAHQLCLQGGAS